HRGRASLVRVAHHARAFALPHRLAHLLAAQPVDDASPDEQRDEERRHGRQRRPHGDELKDLKTRRGVGGFDVLEEIIEHDAVAVWMAPGSNVLLIGNGYRCSKTARAMARSSKSCFSVPTIWYVSWPFPAISTTSPGAARRGTAGAGRAGAHGCSAPPPDRWGHAP